MRSTSTQESACPPMPLPPDTTLVHRLTIIWKINEMTKVRYIQTPYNCSFSVFTTQILCTDIKLLCARDTHKDQTFFLSQVPQHALRYCMFPLGDLLKDEVKRIACEHGLERIARKRESTGICFVGKRNFTDFITEVSVSVCYAVDV